MAGAGIISRGTWRLMRLLAGERRWKREVEILFRLSRSCKARDFRDFTVVDDLWSCWSERESLWILVIIIFLAPNLMYGLKWMGLWGVNGRVGIENSYKKFDLWLWSKRVQWVRLTKQPFLPSSLSSSLLSCLLPPIFHLSFYGESWACLWVKRREEKNDDAEVENEGKNKYTGTCSSFL